MSAPDADLVILGGGCAGLSLGARLAEAESAGAAVPRVLIVEPRDHYTDDRTWSFWRVKPHDFEDIIEARWWRWRLSSDGQCKTAGSERYCYESIPALAFYRRCLDRISESRAVTLIQGTSADRMHDTGASVRIAASNGDISARRVIDTRPPPRSATAGNPSLYQAFRGVRVACSAARFDPSVVGLMMDMESDQHGFRFTYILPYRVDEALIEATRFSPTVPPQDVLSADLQAALRRVGAGDHDTVVRREQGVIPMGLRAPSSVSSAIIQAGTRGGAVRAASGYAFLRIDAWARETARRIVAGKTPSGPRANPMLTAFMDRVFLATIRRDPALAPDVFLTLGRDRMAESLVRFLSDVGTPVDMARIITALPARPFLLSALAAGPKARSPSIIGKANEAGP